MQSWTYIRWAKPFYCENNKESDHSLLRNWTTKSNEKKKSLFNLKIENIRPGLDLDSHSNLIFKKMHHINRLCSSCFWKFFSAFKSMKNNVIQFLFSNLRHMVFGYFMALKIQIPLKFQFQHFYFILAQQSSFFCKSFWAALAK